METYSRAHTSPNARGNTHGMDFLTDDKHIGEPTFNVQGTYVEIRGGTHGLGVKSGMGIVSVKLKSM